MILDADGRELAPRLGAPVGHLSQTGAEKRNELLRNAIQDARVQLAIVRARARRFPPVGVSPEQAADRAERKWRAGWPGLAALIDHADGA